MIIAFTGAGISKASNIPTFMERPDVRDKLFRTYANSHPADFNRTMRGLWESMQGAMPNDAHVALAEYGVDVITMNIDGLHQKAGSEPLELHGSLPTEAELDRANTLYNKPVLYGDAAPNYTEAYMRIGALTPKDTLLIIGVSGHTMVAAELRAIADQKGAQVVEVQSAAETEVRKILAHLQKSN